MPRSPRRGAYCGLVAAPRGGARGPRARWISAAGREGGGGRTGAALPPASVGDMDVCPAVARACSFPFVRVC